MEYSCELCGKSFSRKDSLERHSSTIIHSPLLQELRKHQDVHARLKAFSVEIGKPDLMYCITLLLNIRDRVVEYHLKLDESHAHV